MCYSKVELTLRQLIFQDSLQDSWEAKSRKLRLKRGGFLLVSSASDVLIEETAAYHGKQGCEGDLIFYYNIAGKATLSNSVYIRVHHNPQGTRGYTLYICLSTRSYIFIINHSSSFAYLPLITSINFNFIFYRNRI